MFCLHPTLVKKVARALTLFTAWCVCWDAACILHVHGCSLYKPCNGFWFCISLIGFLECWNATFFTFYLNSWSYSVHLCINSLFFLLWQIVGADTQIMPEGGICAHNFRHNQSTTIFSNPNLFFKKINILPPCNYISRWWTLNAICLPLVCWQHSCCLPLVTQLWLLTQMVRALALLVTACTLHTVQWQPPRALCSVATVATVYIPFSLI